MMEGKRDFLYRVVAGAVFGVYMAHLLYFLNPQIELGEARLLFVTVVYGISCGLVFGSLLYALRLLRGKLWPAAADGTGTGFGFIVAASFLSALVYWAHLVVLRIYLPRGAIRILSKATSLIGVTFFLLLLLWLVQRSARKPVSRLLIGVGFGLILVSSFFLYERRDQYEPDVRTAVAGEAANVSASARPVVLIAIRDLPHDWLVTIEGEGGTPVLGSAMEAGYLSRLVPFPTSNWKALWASLATGKLPYRHGVTGRYSYQTPVNRPGEPYLLLPKWVGFQVWGLVPPVERIATHLPSGATTSLWEMVERYGFDATVVAWPGIAAARTVTSGSSPRLESVLRDLSAEDRANVRLALRRDLSALERAREERVAGDRLVVAAALEGLTVILDAARDGSNVLPGSDAMAGLLIRGYLAEIDGALAPLLEATRDGTVAIVSASGPEEPKLPATPFALARYLLPRNDPGNDDGFMLLVGEAYEHRRGGVAEVTDLVPTLLFGAGLPIARDMDGKIVSDAFTEEFLRSSSLTLIQSYDLPGDRSQRLH